MNGSDVGSPTELTFRQGSLRGGGTGVTHRGGRSRGSVVVVVRV